MIADFTRWPMHVTGKAKGHPPVREENHELLRGYAEDGGGLLLEAMPETIPANQAFTAEELERRIEAHRERIEAELKRVEAETPELGPRELGPRAATSPRRAPSLPFKLKYDDLKIVNCAKCQRTLLGESQEVLRIAAREQGLRSVTAFPPPVGARRAGRPYCAECV